MLERKACDADLGNEYDPKITTSKSGTTRANSTIAWPRWPLIDRANARADRTTR